MSLFSLYFIFCLADMLNVIGVVGGALLIISWLLMGMNASEGGDCEQKAFLRYFKCSLLSLFIIIPCILIPSKKQFIEIYGIKYLTNNQDISALPTELAKEIRYRIKKDILSESQSSEKN